MTPGRGTAIAIALLVVALATAGCGLGPGESVGEVSLTVTRDNGATPVLAAAEEVVDSDTVMRVLERNAEITTRYGGGFVQSIEGIAGDERDGRSYDWFFYVNGVESTIGAADYSLHGGEAIWWDYRDWSSALRVPAVVGSWPQPFKDGYDGERHPVTVECRGGGTACAEVRERLAEAGAQLSDGDDAIRVLVGPWERVREDAAAAAMERGPQESGVFAEFERAGPGYRLVGLDEDGGAARDFGRQAGLVAATRRYEAPPVWVVTGTAPAGVQAAVELLDRERLRDHYAVATEGGEEAPLPLP
jgi:uncharacterized protein DUF4430